MTGSAGTTFLFRSISGSAACTVDLFFGTLTIVRDILLILDRCAMGVWAGARLA